MIRNNDCKCKATLKAAAVVSVFLLFAAVAGFGQQQINLTAAPTTATLPDGTTVPMWGYFCGTALTGSTATCAPLNPNQLTPASVTPLPWAASKPYTVGQLVLDTNGNVQVVTTAGTSAAPPPTWGTTTGATSTDGGGVGFTFQSSLANFLAANTSWSPVVITVPTGATGGLLINLTNNLSFTPTGSTTANTIPTSIVIVGQVGGGLGNVAQRTITPSPSHADAQGCPSWFIASQPPGTPCTTSAPLASPPLQGPRVQSMATEVAAVPVGSTTAPTPLTWSALKPGTYLLESGTHPSIQVPMGLIGVLVVTTAPSGSTAGTAYPASSTAAAVPYNAELPLEFSEIDPVQNKQVDQAVRTAGFSETTVWSGMNPNGVLPGLTLTNAGAGYTATDNPMVTIGGGGGTGATAVATLDPVNVGQIILTLTNGGTGYTSAPTVFITPPASGTQATATVVFSPIGCAATHTCYPPAVNYTPFYYLINGVAFSKTNPTMSLFQATAGVTGTPPVAVTTGITGTVLARLVNASPRMHVPSIVGSLTQGFNGAGAATGVAGFTLIAEDGNVLPNVAPPGATTVPAAPRVQTDVFMAAGKTYDVMVNVPAAVGSATPALPIYDRQLSLSGNSSERDAGMLAYISVNNSNPAAGLPVNPGSGIFAAAQAVNDTYNSLVAGQPFTVSDPGKGVIANDINVYGVTLLTAPTSGTITCTLLGSTPGMCANGTFTYTPNTGSTATSDSFTYCANGTVTGATCSSGLTATVTLGASGLTGNPTAIAQAYTAKTATYIKIPSPGLLLGNTDPSNLPLSLVVTTAPPAGVNWDAQGGFTVVNPTPSTTTATTFTFQYTVQNSQGRASGPGTVTVTFPAPSNLTVHVLDAQAYNNCKGDSTCISGLTPFSDYRWIIEEDKTFWIDPNCTTNSSITTPGCAKVVGPAGQSTIPTFGVNFHTSTMDFVAQGCTGPLSCEGGQTMLDTRPACTNPPTNTIPAGCSTTAGLHIPAVCDLGNGACRPDTTGNGFTPLLPSQVQLDPAKRYYISVLPGDAGSPFNPPYSGQSTCNGLEATTGNNATCGHTMSGAPIPPACNILGGPNACTTSSAFTQPVTVLSLPTPLPTGRLSVVVFEDDFPLNGEQDGGGGSGGTLAPLEPGLGGFNIVLWDTYGGLGDVTGQNTYDMFNQPLSNSLAGTIDPATGFDACPISSQVTANAGNSSPAVCAKNPNAPGCQKGITGMIVTCPKYESDTQTLSPLAGQAVIANLMPEKFSVQAYPGADRIARGEEWIQTNTLDGQHPHDSFIRIGEPSYFQEYGPAGYHVSIGFANPAIINARHVDVCAGAYGAVGACTGTVTGQVNVERLSRTPDQRLYASGSHDALTWTQCWVSLGDPDAEDFMFTKCDANGNFQFTNVPGGNWRLTIGDQWNDQIIDGLSTPANVVPGQTLNLGSIGVQQWQANLYTRTFVDDNKNGIWDKGEIGIPLIYTMIHYRDGHTANNLTTDFNGIASFNETFPLFNWYVVEADSGRYKTTGTHTVYDAGGPADGSPSCGTGNGARACGAQPSAYNYLANTFEAVPLPGDLSVPGAVYCSTANCTTAEANSFAAGTAIPSSATVSTGRIDPPWVWAEGWSGMTSQGNWIDFGKAPYCAGTGTAPGQCGATAPATAAENGGIHGLVVYASTRPFDSAQQMIQQPWEPNVPRVTINLYQEGFAADGVTPTLTMVDTTQTSSWDDWAQGFYPNYTDPVTQTPLPYMSCPGQGTAANGTPNQDLFYYTLFDQPNYLDWYNKVHSVPPGTPPPPPTPLPYNSQYKCYDAMHIWNQVQPAPYDGRYFFPSVLGIDPTTGKQVTTVGSSNGKTASMHGTNCTVCVANPDSTDKYRYGTPMLPPGKYVVEVIMPPGYEVYKEEDKNLLIGDNFIAPVTQEFAGLGTDIFIIPDQANVASMYDQNAAGYNPNNFQDQTSNLNLQEGLSGVPGFPGFQDPNWPCVGEMRVVPDYLSLFPQALEVAPFAGAVRPLCDRKEVTLPNQMSVSAKFFIYTSTHIASKFTGVITDDMTSEFDPFAPQFGEKFAPPNMSISTKDYLGNELSRVYSDHWGIYDGLTFSSWEVNPPNITGYSPSMMVQCMNDPGPIPDPNHPGQMMTDPLYNPAYSDFCYEEPYMPGLTTYLDTPVVPTQAFVGAAYNLPDCSYPDTTPAIKQVNGDGVGPWVSAAGHALTITSLGDQQVPNSAYSGPSANVAPFNLKTVTHHYGFGTTQGTGSVTIGGLAASITSWADNQIVVTVPTGVPNCAIQQQTQYGGSAAQCGQLVITAGNGKQSVDTVTVTIGGKVPQHVSASSSIQGAIDAANPGDLIMVDPGSHTEMLIMWKPVRLQGVGAASSIINANAHPAGKLLDPWRRHINCLFGLTLQGVPYGSGTPYDPTGTYTCPDAGWVNFTAQPNAPQIDRLPLEATVGWDATLNGNLAEQLQEPSLMGAYEGAGITVLGKGLDFHGAVPWNDGTEGGGFPPSTTLLSGVGPDPTALPTGDNNPFCTDGTSGANRFPSNFTCNPSSIDGLSVINSSQGGGGIFAHGWAHHLQIANNRVYNNAGTLSGGISVGQGEFATPYVQGGTTNAPPGSCSDGTGFQTNQHLPYCLQLEVNVHNNFITNNSSLGDELFSATLAGGGGTTFCTGNDYYKFNYNWVCGNLSAGEGGGLVHLGEIQNGDIEHNSVVFNQSTNPTIPTNGGGIQVMGTPDTDPTCGTQNEADCPPGLSDGIGHNLTINANLIQGNSADSGSGGGIRLQEVNGTEVATFPTQPALWNNVSITNNVIVNNLAGWDGAGISLQDSLNVSIINNTIVSNDSLASSGVLTFSIGAPMSSAPPGTCVQPGPTGPTTASCPQSAGVTSMQNSPLLLTSLAGLTITCPLGQPNCAGFSNPLLIGDVIWQNRSFYIGVGNLGQGNLNQQKLISLFDAFTGNAAPVQTYAGQCSAASYWDIGVRGDTGPSNHNSGFTLGPVYSVLDDPGDYSGLGNSGNNPDIVAQYCNGSRVPPTCTVADGCGGPSGYGVPPGIVDASAPNPVFSLTPAATVDEGNNWINVSWGPLAASDASLIGPDGNYGGGPPFVDAHLLAGSRATDYIPCSNTGASHCAIVALPGVPQITLPTTDFYGNPRPDGVGPTGSRNCTPNVSGHACVDVGAIESVRTGVPSTLTSISPNSGVRGTSVAVTIYGTGLAYSTVITVSGTGVTVTNPVFGNDTAITATFVIAANAPLTARNVTVNSPGGPLTLTDAFTVTPPPAPTLTSIMPTTGVRGTTVAVTLTGTNLAGATAVTMSGGGSITCTITTPAPTATTVNASCVISSTAGLTARNVTVTTPGGSSTLPGAFTVQGPTLTSINPTTGVRGTTVAVTLTGTNLAGATAVTMSGGGSVTCTTPTVTPDGTTVTTSCTISSTAALTARNVTVTTPIGTATLPAAFTVQGPTLTSINPTTGVRGTTVPVTLTGTNLAGATAVTMSGGGSVTCTITTPAPTATTVNASCVISPTAGLSPRNVTVTTPIGTATLPGAFTVTGATVTFSPPSPGLTTTPGNTTAKTGTVTVSNAPTATGPLTLTAGPTIAKTSGTGNGTFSIVTGPGTTCVSGLVVNPGSSCTILVSYSGETNTATANGRVTITGTGLPTPTSTLNSPTFPAN